MIKIDQGLIKAFIDGNFGLPIAHENIAYEPTPGEAYAELIVAQNDSSAYSLKHSDQTDGVFRVILRYPLNGGAVAPKQKAEEILAAFGIGTRITYEGQRTTITRHGRQPGVREEGWHVTVLTMSYQAFIKRTEP